MEEQFQEGASIVITEEDPCPDCGDYPCACNREPEDNVDEKKKKETAPALPKEVREDQSALF